MSDYTDKVDSNRKQKIHYSAALANFKVELNEHETNKKQRILELAEILKESGWPQEQICEKVGDDLEGYLSKQYVRKVLGDEFKNKKHASKHAQNADEISNETATSSGYVTNEDNELEQPKKMLIATNGEVIDEDAEKALDEIYNPVQFKKRLNEEIQEDKDNDSLKAGLILSQTTEDQRRLIAQLKEQEEIITQLRNDFDAETKKYSKSLSEKQQYKVQNVDLMKQLTALQNEMTQLRLSKRCSACQAEL